MSLKQRRADGFEHLTPADLETLRRLASGEAKPRDVADTGDRQRCPDCQNLITVGPDGTEYGHEKGERSGRGRCPRRPRGVDPAPGTPGHVAELQEIARDVTRQAELGGEW